jgi:predicted RNase H-like HicB family nuclease
VEVAENVVSGGSVPNLRHVYHCQSCGKPIVAVPILKCGDCGDVLPLRTFYYQTLRGDYVAECIDLDLIAEGQTAEEAIGGLQEAVYGYVNVALDGDTYGLLPRPSPLSHRLHYHCRRLWSKLKRRDNEHQKHFVIAEIQGCHR